MRISSKTLIIWFLCLGSAFADSNGDRINSELKRTDLNQTKREKEISNVAPEIETLEIDSTNTNSNPEIDSEFPQYKKADLDEERPSYKMGTDPLHETNEKISQRQNYKRERANFRKAVKKQFELNATAAGVDPTKLNVDIEKELEFQERKQVSQ